MPEADPELAVALPSRAAPRMATGRVGAVMLAAIALPCFLTLPWSLQHYDDHHLTAKFAPPIGASLWGGDAGPANVNRTLLGRDSLGRSLTWRCLLGGAISLGVGVCAAAVSVVIGVTWGALAGYLGGRADAVMMRIVDILYGLPYILLVVLIDIALQQPMARALQTLFEPSTAKPISNLLTLVLAIGGVSWLTMARVIRGQVLSLRAQPFIEAARAYGSRPLRILRTQLLPNLAGPIIVYATLAVPLAILQESFLSFLGIGVQQPLPSWGNLATAGVDELPTLVVMGTMKWWLLLWPALLLAMTLLGLNFLGDALRRRLDPQSAADHR